MWLSHSISDGRELTPHMLALCILIDYYVTHANIGRAKLAAFLLHLIKNVDESTEPTCQELCAQITSVDKVDVVFTKMLKHLKDTIGSIDVPDDVFELFSGFDKLLITDGAKPLSNKSYLNRSSVFGLYFREAIVTFNSMPFGRVSSFFDSLLKYRDDMNTPRGILPKRALLLFIYNQVIAIERTIGRVSFQESAMKIEQLMKHSSRVPQVYFLRYLNCLHHKEFEGALSSLHHYFDASGTLGDASVCRSQYAILSLAILHDRFGNLVEAKEALHESVRIAQQNNDEACLVRALALLCHMEQKQGNNPSTLRLLNQSVSVSPTRLTDVEGSAEMGAQNWMQAAKCALQGSTHSSLPQSVLQRLKKSFLHVVQSDSANEWIENSASEKLIRASVWYGFGNRVLAQTQLETHVRHYPYAREASLALANLAEINSGDSTQTPNIVKIVENCFPQPMSCIPELSAKIGFKRAMYRNDKHTALALVERLTSLAPSVSTSSMFQTFVDAHYAQAEYYLHYNRLTQANVYCLEGLRQCTHHQYVVESVRFRLLLARIHQAANTSVQSLPLVLSCVWICSSLNLDILSSQSLLLLARIHLEMGEPRRALITARKPLLFILENCNGEQKARVHLLIAECLIALCTQNGASQDSQLNESYMVNETLKQDCCSGMDEAFALLQRAFSFSEQIEHIELQCRIIYISALLCDYRGQVNRRDELAQKFCSLLDSSTSPVPMICR